MSDKFAEILKTLQEPFPSSYIEWKPQSKSKDERRAMAVAYFDARRYQERLDHVCPGWSSRVELMANGAVAKVAITITVDGMSITREDVGESSSEDANTVTTAVAQAFKRACAQFGLGRYLYHLPRTWCEYDPERKVLVTTPRLPAWAVPESERTGASQSSQPAAAAVKPAAVKPENFRIHFGKNAGRTLEEVWAMGKDGEGWIRWCAEKFEAKSETDLALQRMAKVFLMTPAPAAS